MNAEATHISAAHAGWEECDNCGAHTTPRLIVWTEGGRLNIGPESDLYASQAPKVAGHLFLAGIEIEAGCTLGSWTITTDPKNLAGVITVLRGVGADLTIVNA